MRLATYLTRSLALAVLTTWALGGSASADGARPRVVGGSVPEQGSARFMVSLRIPESSFQTGPTGREGFCGGVLIRPDVVATAAHCFDFGEEFYGGIPSLRIGSRLNDHPRGEVRARGVLVNRRYDPAAHNARHDTALVFLERPSGHSPIPLATRAAPRGSLVTLYGWGATDMGRTHRHYPRYLRAATLQVEPAWVCAEANPVGGELCAGWYRPRRDACVGDSGGPLVSRARGRAVVVGLVAYGHADCNRGWGVYADVARNRWLHRWSAQGHRIGGDFYAENDHPAWVN